MRRKVYGQSAVSNCPFCGDNAYSKNPQGVPVCKAHSKALLQNLKCHCGDWLDIRESKYGAFFTCMKCGAINMRKMLEVNMPLKPYYEKHENKERRNRPKGEFIHDKIRRKLKSGEPLSLDELEFI
jgi:hypothetical protein